LVQSAPLLMKALAVAGTAAMFFVGGSILRQGIPTLAAWQGASGHLADVLLGFVARAILVFLASLFRAKQV
jgi:uncharacterized protein